MRKLEQLIWSVALLSSVGLLMVYAYVPQWLPWDTSAFDISMDGAVSDWPVYGRDAGGTRYSPLDQINRENVLFLEEAWTYRTGDYADGSDGRQKTTFQATPILVDGTLYFSTVYGRVIALDPESGEARWTYDPGMKRSGSFSDLASRGVSTWVDDRRRTGEPCRRRIFVGTYDARLIALDAAAGEPCTDFGVGGQVDLTVGIRNVRPGHYGVTSPPAVIGDLVVVGSAIGDNGAVEMADGSVRAYDARDGTLRWRWEPVPRHPADPARDTWQGDGADKTGAANAWSILSVDAARDLVFVPTGSASPDYYGGERLGSNSYANSVVALRGSTGEVVWHYQLVHHDLWDYDLPAQPVLLDVKKDGVEIPAVAQVTKMGFLFLLHRETGEPIFPVEERPVPQSTVPGEETWPTQPFPTHPPPLAPTRLTPDDAWGLTPWDRGWCRDKLERHRNEGIFTPPSLGGSIQSPGIAGGSNWGGLAFEPNRGLAVLNMTHLPYVVRLIPIEDFEAERAQAPEYTEFAPQAGTPYGMSRAPLLSPLGLPCIQPPWGTLIAVELGSGDLKWEVPLGTIRDIAPVPLPIEWGTPSLGGPIVTAGGLIFIGAAMDDYLRAFDIETGEELWKARLPAGGQATPMTYRLTSSSRQFVVIAAGGHGRLGTTIGDHLVAFALPE